VVETGMYLVYTRFRFSCFRYQYRYLLLVLFLIFTCGYYTRVN